MHLAIPQQEEADREHDAATVCKLIERADACVACGMCLPKCPTYAHARNEAESPRGRIALVRALAEGKLQVSPPLVQHLDHCLVCRACEAVCPAGVEYGAIIDAGRALVNAASPRTGDEPWPERLLAWAVRDNARLHGAGRVVSLYQKSGVRGLARRLGILRGLGLSETERKLPDAPLSYRWNAFYPAAGEERGRVALFTGCVADLFDRRTLRSAIGVLTRLGFGVHVPRGQGCCGAIDLHAGRPRQAAALARRNLAAFGDLAVDAVLGTASGCTAVLSEYAAQEGFDPHQRQRAAALAAKVHDISVFLNRIEWPSDIRYTRLAGRVAVHVPCTLRNVLKKPGAAAQLLERIPGLDVVPLDEDTFCCGAAGTNMLRNPALANNLGRDIIAQASAVQATLLATSNVGCALHLLGLSGPALEVVHPVTLLARAMEVAA